MVFFLSAFFFRLSLKAQQNHFVYIQTDNRQPFYVKLDKMVYSSSYTGYLIISKLKTGTYNLIIGFPKNQWPEQSVHFAVEDKDLGYLLKNFGDKGWGFFNLQTLTVLMAVNSEKKADNVINVKDRCFFKYACSCSE